MTAVAKAMIVRGLVSVVSSVLEDACLLRLMVMPSKDALELVQSRMQELRSEQNKLLSRMVSFHVKPM